MTTHADAALQVSGVTMLTSASVPDLTAQRVMRTALGQYATGVAVATTLASDGCPVGLTVNSFSSLSLDPPLVLWCLSLGSASLSAFTAADYFAINVLAASQERLARMFAARAPDRFADLIWHCGARGMPLLHGRQCAYICRRTEQIHRGDHLIIIGQLEEYEVVAGRAPLIFYDGRFHAQLPESTGLRADI